MVTIVDLWGAALSGYGLLKVVLVFDHGTDANA